jgi:DNA-binding SARP family transcriptional activator
MFRVLGPMTLDNEVCTLTAAKPRVVLVLLLLQANRMVPVESLIDELWGEDPPVSASNTVQTYVYQIRKVLRRCSDGTNVALTTTPGGYTLRAAARDLDALEFDRLVDHGNAALYGGDAITAADTLRRALGLWRGPALAGVVVGRRLSAHVDRLEERRLQALERRVDADFQLGRHRELVSELKGLISTFPQHEGFHGQLMLALYRSGRRSDALVCYQRLRHTMIKELGLEPTADLQRLHRAILSSDPELLVPVTVTPRPARPRPARRTHTHLQTTRILRRRRPFPG